MNYHAVEGNSGIISYLPICLPTEASPKLRLQNRDLARAYSVHDKIAQSPNGGLSRWSSILILYTHNLITSFLPTCHFHQCNNLSDLYFLHFFIPIYRTSILNPPRTSLV